MCGRPATLPRTYADVINAALEGKPGVEQVAFAEEVTASGAVDVAPDPTAPGGDLAAHLIPIQRAAEELARVRPDVPSQSAIYRALARNGGPWRGLDDLEIATCAWVSWFNEERIHGELHDRSPAQVEAAYYRHQSQPDAA